MPHAHGARYPRAVLAAKPSELDALALLLRLQHSEERAVLKMYVGRHEADGY
jgi:hypothetical protein